MRENGRGNEGGIEKIWRLWGAVVQIQSERNKQRRDDENLHDMQGNRQNNSALKYRAQDEIELIEVYGAFCRLKLKKDAQKHGPLVFVNFLYTAICDYYYLAANLT